MRRTRTRLPKGLKGALLAGSIGALAFCAPAKAQDMADAVARDLADRVCLSAAEAALDGREGPCKKVAIVLDSAGLRDTLSYALVQTVLGHIWIGRGDAEVATGHYEKAARFAQSAAIASGQVPGELAVLTPGSPAYCVRSAQEQRAIALADLRQAWLAADNYARGAIFPAHAPMPDRSLPAGERSGVNLAAKRLFVLLGALFPHFNRPMDARLLTDRLVTRSVPAFSDGYDEHKIALMEALLISDGDSDGIAVRFVGALARLEQVTLTGELPVSAAEVDAAISDHAAALEDFAAMMKQVLTSDALAQALQRRQANFCWATRSNEENIAASQGRASDDASRALGSVPGTTSGNLKWDH